MDNECPDEMYNPEAYEMFKAAEKNLERAKKMTKEEALATLVRAGLVTKDGKPTPHYAPRKEPPNYSI